MTRTLQSLLFFFLALNLYAANRVVSLHDSNDIKAGYLYQKDYSLLPKMKAQGINVAMVKLGWSLPVKEKERNRVKKWSRICKEYDIPFAPVLNVFGSELRKHSFRAFVDLNGKHYTNTPCCTDEDFWEFSLDRIIKVSKYNPDVVICDLEMHYSALDNRYPGPCYCDYCINTFKKEFNIKADNNQQLRRIISSEYSDKYYDFQLQVVSWFANRIRDSIDSEIVLGAFHLDTSLALRNRIPFYDGLASGFQGTDDPNNRHDVFSFSEYTYLGKAWHDESTQHFLSRADTYFGKLGLNVRQIPGISMEFFTPDEFESVMERYKQFWIFRISALGSEYDIQLKHPPASYWRRIKNVSFSK